ncbi:MAG: Ig-like domain-containing protein [Bacteroidota bacterium]
MRLITPFSIFVLILLGSISPLWGQLPPNQPEQDCVNALPVCQNIFVQQNSYQGEGLDPNEIDGTISCLGGGEVNDSWYIFTVQAPGLVDFVISPVDPFDDYDWAVYNLTTASCADIATNAALEVSCNFSGISGNTGPTASQPAGGQINVPIPVLAGETYVVNVSNWSGSTTGYTLDFSGSTAVIFDNVPPEMDPLSSNCGTGNITIPFSENVLCNTVDPTDFTLTGPGGPYTVTGVFSPVCTAGGTFDDEFTLQVTPAITMTGTYTVTIIDDILDNCGNICLYTSEDIFISNTAMTVSASPADICEGDQTTLSSSLSGVPGYTFDWQPIGSNSSNPVVSPVTTTTYTLTATDAAGCPSVAQVTVTVKPTPTSTFTAPLSICENQFASVIYTGSAPTTAIYQWDFGVGATTNSSGQGPYGVTYSSIGAKTISLNVIQDGCPSVPSTQLLNVILVPTAQISGPNDVCIGDTAYYTYQGNAPATATFNWNFDGATYVENLGLPSAQGPYKVVWSTDGAKTVCIQVDNQSCLSGIACQTTNVLPKPNAAIDQVANQCLAGNSFNFVYTDVVWSADLRSGY